MTRPNRSHRRLAVAFFACVALIAATAAPAGAAPISLLVPQGTAFTFLGHWCGGIQEQALATGFAPTTGYPTGDVYIQTRCGGSGRDGGGHVTTYSAWVSVSWTFAGTVSSGAKLTTAPTGLNPALSITDSHGDHLYNTLGAVNVTPANCSVSNTTYCTYRAYLSVPAPGAPTGVKAVQTGDQFRVSWTPTAKTAALITSSQVTATPVGSSAPVLTATTTGTAKTALVGPLQPQTTYQVTVISTDPGGSSPASSPVTATTGASAVVPAAPGGVTAHWTAPGLPGDSLAAGWKPASGGDSPVDEYQVTITVHDGDPPIPGPFTQTVTSTSASFTVDDSFDWSVQVRAHDAAGWGPWSTAIVLGGA